ncbi:MAG: methionyl-tRNA formyltransferase [Thermomicrobiales bacterium]
MAEPLRVIFMGTPMYAVPSLRALHGHADVALALVVTQPDRPQGRGRKLQSPPVRLTADELEVPVLQVSTLREASTRELLESTNPDLVVVAAFGIILGAKTLSLPKFGCINLHASLLPKYRGANPIAAAIAMGEAKTGVTLMQMEQGLDTGPILSMNSLEIDLTDTTATLTPRLAELAGELLRDSIADLASGLSMPKEQPAGASLTRPMTKDDGWIDWTKSAADVANHVRAMVPWPRAWTTLPDGSRLQIHAVETRSVEARAGAVTVSGDEMVVGCGSGSVHLTAIQFPGGNVLADRALIDKTESIDGLVMGISGVPIARSPLVVDID